MNETAFKPDVADESTSKCFEIFKNQNVLINPKVLIIEDALNLLAKLGLADCVNSSLSSHLQVSDCQRCRVCSKRWMNLDKPIWILSKGCVGKLFSKQF